MPRILIADDEWVTRAEIEEIFTDLGYEVVGQAETGAEAIDMARRLEPDLIVMDVVMPGEMNGIDAARVIQAERGTPVIFITGYGDPEYIEAAKETAPFGYVMKPFDEREVHAFVEIALSRREFELKLMKAHEGLERAKLILQEEIASRKNTEKALRESERLYRNIFEKSRAIQWVLDPSTGKIIDANPAACEFYQYSYEEITELYLWDIDLLGEAEIKKVLSSAEIEEQTEFTFKHRKASGEIRSVQIYTGNFESGGKRLLHSIIIDITERKRAEELLRESEEKLRAINDTALDSIFCKNINRQYTFVNPAMIQLLGRTRDDLIGKVPDEVFNKENAAIVNEVDERTLNGEKVSGIRTLIVAGRPRTFQTIQVPLRNADGNITGISGIVRDVTDFVQTEKALRESEKLYQDIFKKNNAMKWLLDPSSGRIIDANPAACEFYQYSHEEITNLRLWDINTKGEAELKKFLAGTDFR